MSLKLHDTDDDIKRCLECPYDECINCLAGVVYRSATEQQRSVQQIDLETGEIIATFSTISAAVRATGASRSSINRTLNGTNKSAGGYFWKEV